MNHSPKDGTIRISAAVGRWAPGKKYCTVAYTIRSEPSGNVYRWQSLADVVEFIRHI